VLGSLYLPLGFGFALAFAALITSGLDDVPHFYCGLTGGGAAGGA
jgi:hypothetical protein